MELMYNLTSISLLHLLCRLSSFHACSISISKTYGATLLMLTVCGGITWPRILAIRVSNIDRLGRSDMYMPIWISEASYEGDGSVKYLERPML
jgi:hypothetical protein